jgi:hypothetical protein
MNRILLCFFLLWIGKLGSQNNVRFYSADGSVFKLKMMGSVVNKVAEASVLVESVASDTLKFSIQFERGEEIAMVVYLLDKGKKTLNKEYDFKIIPAPEVKAVFTGMYDPVVLPNPLVPKPPVVDSSARVKQNSNLVSHFYELKEGKPAFFNNIPGEGGCREPMPASYLDHAEQLMRSATTDYIKYSVAVSVCQNNCLSTGQLISLMKYIDYELDKLKLAKLALPVLTDPDNLNQVARSFKFDSSFQELKKAAGK